MSDSNLTWRAIVGLEIHVQLRTATKLFCGCAVETDAPPNARTCPVCLGHPGTLPVMNAAAFHHALLVGLALDCQIAPFTKWDRKSYFYPDMPKNYQISQYDLPLASGGRFEFMASGGRKSVRIRRAHLEEDAGKSIHEAAGGTAVDLNRAGTPLVEIVTEPDLESADDAYAFAVELQRLMRWLGVSDAVMQRGQMRFEPNVNLEIESGGRRLRTPIAEIKNLNSFRSLRNAIDYECRRQVSQWRADPGYVVSERPNENRGWNDDAQVTEFQRGKEAAHDYRYFPDPDLAPASPDDELLASIRGELGELPVARRQRFVTQYALSDRDAETIVDDRATAEWFEAAVGAGGPAGTVGKQLVNVWMKLAHDRGATAAALGVGPARAAELAALTAEGTISATAANQIAVAMLARTDPPRAIAEALGLLTVRDEDATRAWVAEALAANPGAVSDARSNPKKKKAALGFLRGQVMRVSGGQADPAMVAELIERRLKEVANGE